MKQDSGVIIPSWLFPLCAILYVIIFLEISSAAVLGHLVNPMRLERFEFIYGENQDPAFKPHPFLGYVTSHYAEEAQQLIKSLGENRTNRVYLVAMGGSTTESGWPAYAKEYLQKRLAEHDSPLEVEAFNFGVGGWSTPNSVQNYFYLVRYLHPDFVIIHHNTNDISMGPMDQSSEEFLNRTAAIYYPRVSSVEKKLIKLSRFYTLLKFVYIVSYNQIFQVPIPGGPFSNEVPEPARISSFLGDRRFTSICCVDPDVPFGIEFIHIDYRPPEGEPHFILKENYETLIRYTRADNSTLILTTQYLNYSKASSEAGDNLFWPLQQEQSDEINQFIRALSREHNASLVDFDAEMTSSDYLLSEDGIHFILEGERLKGELVGAAIFEILAERHNLSIEEVVGTR